MNDFTKEEHEGLIEWLNDNISAQESHLKTQWIADDKYTYGHAEGFLMCYREVLEKLQSLTQDKPKPKYEEGMTLWMVDCNKPEEFFVERITREFTENKIHEFVYNGWPESEVYPSKQDLIEKQIQYWQQKLIEEYCPPFEGEIKGFDARHACSEEGQQRIREGLRQLIDAPLSSCCSVHTGTTEECPHECKWDGVLVSMPPNMGRCKICGEMCYVALGHGKWLKGECEMTPVKDREHNADTQINQDEVNLDGCPHESDIENPQYCPGLYNSICLGITPSPQRLNRYFKCKHCGEFYK